MRPTFFFAVILILVAVAATSGPTDFVKERYRRCGGAFDCANIKNISYPFWGPNRPTYCGHPAFELECTGENPVITIRSERYRILDINLVGRSFAVARADYKDTSCPRTLSNTTIDPTLFRFGSDSQNLTLYYDCPPPATVLGPATLVSAIAANGFNCSNVTGYWRNSVKDTSGAPPAMVEYLAACRLSVLVPAFRALAREIGSLRSLLNSGFGLEWDANNEVCSNCEASGGRCGHESGHFACFCSRGVFPAACITGKNDNKGLVIGIAVGSAAAVGIGLLSAAYFVVRRRKHLKIAHSKTKEEGGGGPSSSSMPTASPFAGTPMVPLTNFHESTPFYGGGRPDLESGGTYLGVRVFSYDELEEATDNFDASKELGDGGFGVVYYGQLRDGRAVAVKRLYERNFKRVEQFMNEVQILTRLCHPNLVTLYGCTSRRSRELLLVYEYIPNGTLADHLHGSLSGSGSLPWPLRLAIAMETAVALAYLHASDIIHRDVKTTNILLDCNFHVKVADFGLSRLFPDDVTHVSTAPQGTPGYVDPEYYQCYHLTDRSDVYSFGVVLVELFSSKKAVDTNRHRHDVNLANMAVSRMQSRSLHELVDPCLGFEGDEEVRRAVMAVAELAFLCLQLDREMRPSMDEVVEGLRRIESGTDGMKSNYIINDDALGGVRGVKREVVHSVSPTSVVNTQWASVRTAPNSL